MKVIKDIMVPMEDGVRLATDVFLPGDGEGSYPVIHVRCPYVKENLEKGELDDNNPSKNDRKDPKVIAGLVKDGRYFRPYIPDGIYAEI